MAALGDVGRVVVLPTQLNGLALPGALGVGNVDFSREVPPRTNSGGGGGPTLPTYGQIFPSGR